MLALRGLLVIAACRVAAATPPASAKAVYDQRQTGDLNVQIELKNLQVVALLNSELLDDYTDYDYFYDYADFTVKPGNRPTTGPTTAGTTERNDITQAAEPVPPLNSITAASVGDANGVASAAPSNGTASDATPLSQGAGIPDAADSSNGTAGSAPNADKNDDKSQPSEQEQEEDGAGTAPSATARPAHGPRSQKRCKSGYVPNGDGRCRRASRPWLTRLLP
ncbi:PREDICTED: uncharacterized protein LOC105567765 [Vollenhovia emeryi]|uniref:uncharacterized protein LOC105567765 n=1 Tax=Vollenhovia emeryi TaxID=411798 RepID=UPI0005F46711|nr:PREDICTED: uncharacterized protein LOC105567765 [Vollenhovia emeryi]